MQSFGNVRQSFGMVCGLIFTALCLVLTTPADAAPPNIVIILGDDQAWTDYGFMGHPEIKTPHLDRLASQSACFTQGYVPSSLCRPSLACILTGLYTHQHKISGNDPPKGTDRAEMLRHVRRLPMIPKWLGEQGYASFQSGKWWEGAPSEGGFTAAMSHGDPKRGGRHGDVGLKIGREGMQPVFDFLDGIRMSSRPKGKPFFLWYAPMMPHTPHNPPERLLVKYRKEGKPLPIAKYHAMCEWFDETVGELLDHLEKNGQARDTIVVFVCDNGWIQQPDSSQFAPKSKKSPYDGGLRTPILVRWPGHIEPRRIETPVSSVDIAPTILAAVGITPKDPLPGLDLVKLAANGGKSERTAIFGATFEHDVADIDRPEASLQFRWCRQDQWKLIVPRDATQPLELYDLSGDPREEVNLAAMQSARAARLKQQIDTWWTIPD
jgi:uncharacterized sulfatase